MYNQNIPGRNEAIISLVLGIVGLVASLFVNSLVGLLVGVAGLYYASRSKAMGYDDGLRLAGFVLSVVAIVLGGLFLLACVACTTAFVGIGMGCVGSDIAIDAADIALVNDELCQLPHLLFLARRMMFTIRCNLTFSMALNFVAIILAITGILNPVVGALVHNAGSVLVIVNSALLLGWKNRKRNSHLAQPDKV